MNQEVQECLEEVNNFYINFKDKNCKTKADVLEELIKSIKLKTYHCLQEKNNEKKETWYFLFPKTEKNTIFFEKLNQLIQDINSDELFETFQVFFNYCDEYELKDLIRCNEFNKTKTFPKYYVQESELNIKYLLKLINQSKYQKTLDKEKQSFDLIEECLINLLYKGGILDILLK
jgi:predicted ATP-binding protein involved in virulence